MYKVHVVENGVQAKEVIDRLQGEGFLREEVYIFAHDKDTSKDLTDATHSGKVGIKEQGVFDSMGNVFKKRGDELRSKMQNLGLTETEAKQYEEDLDKFKVVVIASK
jgi:hypothetical protein